MSCKYANPNDIEHTGRYTKLLDVEVGDTCLSCWLSRHGDLQTWKGIWTGVRWT